MADVYADGALVTRAFVAGRQHRVDISIGSAGGSIVANRPLDEPEIPAGEDSIELLIRFIASPLQEQTIVLPRDRSRNSSVAQFQLEVAEDIEWLEGLIAIYRNDQRSQLLQAAVIQGPVVRAGREPALGMRIEIDVESPVTKLSAGVRGTADASVVTGAGTMLTAAGETGETQSVTVPRRDLAADVKGVATLVARRADELVETKDAFLPLLRALAIAGGDFRAALVDSFPPAFLTAEHIQVVGADADDLLPLELVYDGLIPSLTSKLCPTWAEVLEAGVCPGCGDAPGTDVAGQPYICPARFWGISKVIERHGSLQADRDSFEIRVERTDERTGLGALTGAIVGASQLVDEGAVEATKTVAQAAFGPATRVSDWAAWRLAVADLSPSVLIALPHQTDAGTGITPALELGQTLLTRGEIQVGYVSATEPPRGPIVLLLGCSTAVDGGGLGSFAGGFRKKGAAVVVSTIGDVLAQSAPIAAQALLDAIEKEQRKGGTIGEAIRQMRRNLLAQQEVLGLLVVAHGDAGWRLGV